MIYILVIALIFPLFPTIFGNSPLHLPILYYCLCVVIIMKCKFVIKFTTEAAFLICFPAMCIFPYAIGIMVTEELIGLNALISLNKYILLSVCIFTGYCYGGRLTSIDSNLLLYRTFLICTLLQSAIVVCELVFPGNSLIELLYKRQERSILLDKATTFFGVTYYSGFFAMITLIYWSLRLRSSGNTIDYILFLLSLSSVLLSQSRSLLIILPVVLALTLIRGWRGVIGLFVIFPLGFFVIVSFEEHFWYVLGPVARIIDNGILVLLLEGSVKVRIDQIYYALESSGFFYGAGPGRLPLENIYASLIYHLGFIFSALFILYFVYFSFRLKGDFGPVMRVIAILHPFLLFSSPMLTYPKFSFFIFILMGVSLSFTISASRNA